ncbi:MAG: DUF1501 domain-containing protein [Polyangiales bacterium]
MSKQITRRALLAGSLGAAQFALLEKFGLTRRAFASGMDGPIKLLVLYIPGGVRFYPFFVPFSDADVVRYIPPKQSPDQEPVFSTPSQIYRLNGDSGAFQPIRVAGNWNPMNPADRTGYNYSPSGYGWIHYDLGPTSAVVHGIDQGSFAHNSSFVSAMCGIAGEAYRAPALVSVVANYLHQRFASARPIPCVAINSSSLPEANNLPAQATPVVIPTTDVLSQLFSSDGARLARWRDSDRRTEQMVPSFNGMGAATTVSLTNVDALVLERTRGFRSSSHNGANPVLEGIYNSYVGVSRTLARDVVTAVQSAMPNTQTQAPYAMAYGRYHVQFGLANTRIDMTASCEWILKLLKSNVTSVVYAHLPERYYDFHNGGSVALQAAASRAQLDIIARMIGEMKATPSPDRPGKTLYDDTLIVVQSEFNRSFVKGPNQMSNDNWQYGDDHNPITSVVLSGGGILGNRQIGNFEADGTRGAEVSIHEEDGRDVMRRPKSADFIATACRVFGMRPGQDFFIPGGYGVINGLCP